MRFSHFIVSLLLVCPLTPAAASDFDDWFEVYREDFIREAGLPASPEIDEMGAGSVSIYDEPSGAGTPPAWTGSVLRLFTNGVTSSQQRTDALPATVGTGSFGVRAGFESFGASVLGDPVSATASAGFEPDAGGVTYGIGVSVRLVPDPPNPPRVFLVLGESEFDPFAFPPLTSRTIEAELDPALASFVQLQPFALEVVATRFGAGRIYGSLTDAEGQLLQGIGDLTLTDFSTRSVVRTSAGLTAEVSGSTSQVDVTELAVFVPFSAHWTAQLGDGVDANPGDGFCDTGTGTCTLRAAIQEANATPGPGRIDLGEGRYVLSIPGTDEDAAATGDLDILDDLEIVGAGSIGLVQTEVDANGLDRVFHVPETALDTVVRFRNLRILDGSATAIGGAYGGGVASWGRVTLDRVFLSNNVSNVGGAIFNARRLWLIDSIVTENLAQTLWLTGRGGGIAGGSSELGASTWNTHTTILRSAVVDNESTVGGAGVDFFRAATAEVSSSTVASNLGTDAFSQNSPLVLDHATIVSDVGTAIETVLAQGASSIRFINTVASGSSPACTLSTFPVFQTFYEGNNASSDTSCGFTAAGSIEGVDLGLVPGDPVALGTIAWLPGPTSPLRDAGDPTLFCPPVDQSGGARPLDSDADGTSVCEIGAMEVPEPGVGLGLVMGIAALAGRARHRQRSGSDREPAGGRGSEQNHKGACSEEAKERVSPVEHGAGSFR